MDNYFILKSIHIALAILSVSLFSVRGVLLLLNNSSYRHRLYRLITPLIDSILLTLGIAMAVIIGRNIWSMDWFVLKISLIICYIITGTLALNRLKVRGQQVKALLMAWIFAAGIFYTALAKPMWMTVSL
ncbi:MAG: SirB2 family protein [Gammaproteobacteria bacterium]